jgi:hypothetical protein
VDIPQDLTRRGEHNKSIIKDWNEFLSHYQGDQLVSNKKIKFFDTEVVQAENKEKKRP